jgi:hypothetical protein
MEKAQASLEGHTTMVSLRLFETASQRLVPLPDSENGTERESRGQKTSALTPSVCVKSTMPTASPDATQ